MTKHIHCGKAVPYGEQAWAYGSMRYCDGKCLMASFQENQLELRVDRQLLREKDVMKESTKQERIVMMREVFAKRKKAMAK